MFPCQTRFSLRPNVTVISFKQFSPIKTFNASPCQIFAFLNSNNTNVQFFNSNHATIKGFPYKDSVKNGSENPFIVTTKSLVKRIYLKDKLNPMKPSQKILILKKGWLVFIFSFLFFF